ncbi:unnamed protein product [Oikopleura dioica]|uniref:HIT domain-containing protein n=1 Tax=Oikopleura dioica TaxID=34765 RepID=E4X9P7_OIKDI|nr:unnamed protein product [Oikopleura dioica]
MSRTKRGCLFCGIIAGVEPGRIRASRERFTIIDDLYPEYNHTLALPNEHIENASTLTKEDIPLLLQMAESSLDVLRAQYGTALDESQVVMGYHWPPFNSQSHLHLHLLYPTSEFSFLHKLRFLPRSPWFIRHSDLISRLEKSS